jgi:hypothetical protein
MQVISTFYTYSEVLSHLDEAKYLYKILDQKYEETVSIVVDCSLIYYRVIIKLLKDA